MAVYTRRYLTVPRPVIAKEDYVSGVMAAIQASTPGKRSRSTPLWRPDSLRAVSSPMH